MNVTDVEIKDGYLQLYDEHGMPMPPRIPGNYDRAVVRSPQEIYARQKNGGNILAYRCRNGQWAPGDADPNFRFQQQSDRDLPKAASSGPTVATSVTAGIGAFAGSMVGKAKEGRRPGTLALMLTVFAIAVGIVIVVSPGMLMVALLQNWFAANWDTGQMWIFSVVTCLGIGAALYGLTRNFRKTLVRYVVLCGAVALLCLVGAFGIKSPFFGMAAQRFVPPSSANATTPKDSPQTGTTQVSESGMTLHQLPPEPSAAPRLTYAIVGLAQNDVLNVRQGPGSNFPIIAKVRASARGIISNRQRVTNGTTVWQQIDFDGTTGWVNSEFLSREVPKQ